MLSKENNLQAWKWSEFVLILYIKSLFIKSPSCEPAGQVWWMTFDPQSHAHSSLGRVVVAVELSRETLLTVRVTWGTLTLVLSHMVVIGAFWLVVYVCLVDQRNPASSIRDDKLRRGLEFIRRIRKVRFFHSVVQRAVECSHHSDLWRATNQDRR